MNRFLCSLVVPLCLLAQAAPAFAQSPAAKKVTLDLNAVAPDAAFKAVGNAIGVTVTVDAAVTTPVDITVRNVSAKTALNAMCESIGCQWTITGGALAVKPITNFAVGVVNEGRAIGADKGKASARAQVVLNALKQKLPADMKFENAPLDEVSRRLSEATGLTVKLTCKDPDVQTLTMDVSNLTLQSALQAMVEQEVRPKAVWRLTVGPLPGDTQTPSIAIMVGPRPAKK